MRSSTLIALTIASSFLGGAATTIIMNARPAPTLAQDEVKPAEPAGEIKTADEDSEVVNDVVAEVFEPKNVVSSDSFELRDAEGKLRAKLGFGSDGGPGLFLYDSDGNEYSQGESMVSMDIRAPIKKEAARLMTIEEHKDPQVELQHILISFAGAMRSRTTRTQDEAAVQAWMLYQQALKGGAELDFGELMKKNSDDPGPGIYTLALSVEPGPEAPQGVYPRTQMIPCFGDLGWRLKVGEVGITDYHTETGAFGYHIIKRLK